ncbi:MAG: hypothetical protein LUC24_00665 [Bacteroidales bacterium]|nr:hypothetical protein [Bacteroidales bacterium]
METTATKETFRVVDWFTGEVLVDGLDRENAVHAANLYRFLNNARCHVERENS